MDEKRFHDLQTKARITGLSDSEADELGRLYAEAQGKPYSRHEPKPPVVASPRRSPGAEVRGRRRRHRLRSPRSLEIGETAILGDGEPEDRPKSAA